MIGVDSGAVTAHALFAWCVQDLVGENKRRLGPALAEKIYSNIYCDVIDEEVAAEDEDG